jgi:hypothetical protein
MAMHGVGGDRALCVMQGGVLKSFNLSQMSQFSSSPVIVGSDNDSAAASSY